MARLLWLLGTLGVGTAIAVGSWYGVRELTHAVQAAAPDEATLLAQQNVAPIPPPPRPVPPLPRPIPPPSRPLPPPPTGNFNDGEAPADASRPAPPKTFIGGLRDSLDAATDLDIDNKDEYLRSLDAAEAEFQKIKLQNKAALERVNRRPPISIPQSPNFIVLDIPGLGYDDLAVFSKKARADQRLDALAEAGLVFTHYYAASSSPAANSCSLLTGLHSGRTRIRGDEPVIPLALDDLTLAEVLWRAGYSTCMLGQWRLGAGDSSGAPFRQGFEQAWYTASTNVDENPVVWSGDRRLANDRQPADWNDFRSGSFDRAISFIDMHRNQPVFVYLSLPFAGPAGDDLLPQLDEQVGRLTDAVSKMNLARETYFFLAGSPGENLPASAAPPLAVPLDDVVVVEVPAPVAKAPPAIPLRDEPAVTGPAPVIPGAMAPPARPMPTNKVIETDFAQDDATSVADSAGQTPPASTDNAFVESLKHREPMQVQTAREVAGLRGSLGDLYEGGVRAPLIVWTSKRLLGGVRNDVVAAWDLLPTLASLSYAQFVPTCINGASFAVRLQVHGDQSFLPHHSALYWESHGDVFKRAFLYGKWKLIQLGERGPVELYNLAVDPQETRNVADQQSELVDKLMPLLDRVRSKSRYWRRAGEPQVEAVRE